MSSNDNGNNPFDWGAFNGWLDKEGLPKPEEILGQPDWVEKYIGGILNKALPNRGGAAGVGKGKVELFQTHRFVVIKINWSKPVRPQALQLFVRADRIKLLVGAEEQEQLIKLPCLIVPRSCRALFKENVLQVKLRKRAVDPEYYEAYIRW